MISDKHTLHLFLLNNKVQDSIGACNYTNVVYSDLVVF